jgi:hypothetical protein
LIKCLIENEKEAQPLKTEDKEMMRQASAQASACCLHTHVEMHTVMQKENTPEVCLLLIMTHYISTAADNALGRKISNRKRLLGFETLRLLWLWV